MIIDAYGKKHIFEADTQGGRKPYGKSGNEEIFETQDGLRFWFDIDESCFKTDDDGIYLYIHNDLFMQSAWSAFFLHIHGRTIAFSHKQNDYFQSWSAERREDGSYYWEIGGIGHLFRYRDPDKGGGPKRVYHALSNVERFCTRAEQEFAIAFITDVLSRFNGVALSMWRGERQTADVIFTNDIQQKLSVGSLVEGNDDE